MILQGVLKKVFQFRNATAKRVRKGADDGFDPEEKPFLDHLEDLRLMFFKMIVTLAVGITACFVFTQPLMNLIRLPMVWANVAEEDAIKAIFHLGPKKAQTRFAPGDLVVTAGGMLVSVVREEPDRGITIAQASPGVEVRLQTETILGKIPAEGAKVAPGDLQKQRLLQKDPLIMETFAPHEGLVIVLKLAFYSAIVITFPLLMWFAMEFIWPGLREAEKRAAVPALFIGFLLFLTGAFFAFRLGLPFALRWLSQWNYQHGMNPGWRVGYYIQFVTQVTLVFGVMFEVPVVVMALVHLEILSYRAMKESRSYAIVILLVVAAFLTPPDPLTLCLLGGPLILLYEICIWLAYFIEKKRRRVEAEEEQRRARERIELEERHARLVAEGKLPAEGAALQSDPASGVPGDPGVQVSEAQGYDPYQDGYSHDYGYQHPDDSGSGWHPHTDEGGVTASLVDINYASLEDLQKLPGVGPKLAQQIVEARPFYSEEDLEYHAYLPPSVIKLIRDRITFN